MKLTAALMLTMAFEAQAQLRPTIMVGGSTTNLPCGDCVATTRDVRVGVVFKDFVGLGYHASNWRSDFADQSFSTRAITLDLRRAATTRITPFFMVGAGNGSARVVSSEGAHASDTSVANNARAVIVGTGLDVRLYRRLAISLTVSAPELTGARRTRCLNDFISPAYCSTSTGSVGYTALGLGIGWR